MQDIKAGIMEFLKSKEIRSKIFVESDMCRVYLHKAEQDSKTDYIFGARIYGGGAFRPDLKTEYEGFIHYPSNTIVDPGYDILTSTGYTEGLKDGGFNVIGMEYLLKEHERIFRETVERLAEHAGLFARAKQEQVTRGYGPDGDKGRADDRAREAYMGWQTSVPYQFEGYIERYLEFDVVEHLNDAQEHAKEKAKKYFDEKFEDVLDGICYNLQINDMLFALINENPSAAEYREMMSSIGDQKTVTLDILKDGKPLTVKYAADWLKRGLKNMEDSLGSWHMDAPGRRAFEATFGRSAYLRPSDIAAIRYSRKSLWSREQDA